MSTIKSPLVTDWIIKGLRWKYVVRESRKPFSIQPSLEKKLHDYANPEGLFLFGLFVFDRPYGGVRIDAYPEWPITLDIPTMYANGVIAPNVWGWLSRYRPDPYTGVAGTYAMVIPEGQVWQNKFEILVINSDPTVTINCTYYLYVMVVLEEARSSAAAEKFEALGGPSLDPHRK